MCFHVSFIVFKIPFKTINLVQIVILQQLQMTPLLLSIANVRISMNVMLILIFLECFNTHFTAYDAYVTNKDH